VAKRILDRRLARRRREDRRAAGVDTLVDLHVGELRQVAVQRFGEPELALFVQREQSDAGNRLGHRIETKDRVGPHRLAGLAVGNAERFLIRHLSASRDGDYHPRQSPGRDLRLDRGVDSRQARGRHADAFRRRARQIGCRHDDARERRRHQRQTHS
jgi:hypothetical protein